MTRVEERLTIDCTPEAFLDFVMDIERYAQVDDKLRAISCVRRDGNSTEFTFRPKLPGVPLPQPKATAQMRLTPRERIDIRLAPPPLNRFNHKMAHFAARFSCEPVNDGICVTRMIDLGFHPCLSWLLEPVLKRTLPESVKRELGLTKEFLERADSGS
ncbi:SRPBCC family protein [Streptomyces sp. NPDC048248]|uniref:SRPBCC family protein n=1 Tax=Streptomyces sp. NPDC048248 TaxID=3365523 RepID=UPI00371E3B41